MSFNHTHYVPCLRWKQGEYLAVSELPNMTKHAVTPLIEAPEIGWDFERGKEAKTIDEHLAPFAKRVHDKWGRHDCFIDLHCIDPDKRMATGTHPVCFVFDRLREIKCSAIPVTGLDRDYAYQQEIRDVLARDESGICVRITIEQAAKSSFKHDLGALLSTLDTDASDCALVLDLGTPNFLPLEGFSRAIQNIVRAFPDLNNWQTFTILGTSFPETMAGIRMRGDLVPRYEWRLYKILVANFREAGLRLPSFGDYAISHPKVLDMDMRIVKPNATIRFTIDDGWYIVKGKNVRDYGYEQFHELSEQVLVSRYFRDSPVSWGKEYIRQCARRRAKRGNLAKWLQVGTNHHIMKVIQDIASFYAS
jgi:hypothetical protein